jgi:hypothetical protein
MEVQVNYLAVLLAGLSSMVVGSVWYMPQVFGKTWAKLSKAKMAGSPAVYVLTLVASLFTAFILAHVTFLSNSFYKDSFMQDALTTAFWLWLGFTAARILVHDLFEGRDKKLFAINAAHELVTVMVMAAIIGAFGVK